MVELGKILKGSWRLEQGHPNSVGGRGRGSSSSSCISEAEEASRAWGRPAARNWRGGAIQRSNSGSRNSARGRELAGEVRDEQDAEEEERWSCGGLLVLVGDDARDKSSGRESKRYGDGVAKAHGGAGDVGAVTHVEGSGPCRGREAGAPGIKHAAATGNSWSPAAALRRAGEGGRDRGWAEGW